ncbi:protein fem-1 homolog C-like [Toxorhynchites rutilus septentrionalis]|uniref:protein fem-1 homolog C-like n=1 Tax=Toxorhynchites rutilus septentrionalis TaxID=329112 RepID=UPI002478AD2C|nr:protein fem-1 homolog C-like [Toxorhynchites rutilus septentrionalis]
MSNLEHLGVALLRQIRYDLFQEVSSRTGPFSRSLRSRLRRLPRYVRKELVDTEYEGCSSLFIACREGNIDMVEFLIMECDANIEQRGTITYHMDETDGKLEDYTVHNVTLLCCASESGNLQIVQYLVRLGCDVNASSDTGSTPLRASCSILNAEIVQYLIENGADIHKPSSNGGTCLIDAIKSAPLCQYLISKGADVNERDAYENTALHYAVTCWSFEMVRVLLDHGADPFAKSRFGDDTLQLACIVGSQDIVEYLLSRINYSRERRAEAYMLLGSSLIHLHHGVQEVVHHWRLALNARIDGPKHIQNKSRIQPRLAFGNMVEFTTHAELDAIAWDVDALRMQGLVIQERILGIDHEFTLHRLMERGEFYKASRQYQACIELWVLTLQVRIRKHTILDSDTCKSARAIVKLMVNLLTSNELMMPKFKDVYATFQLLTANITEIQQLLSVQPADRTQQLNYECILRCLIHLMYLLLSVAKSKIEHLLIRSSVHSLLRQNIRSVSEETLLHLSVSNTSVMKSKYFNDEEGEKRLFSNLPVTKLLLEFGAQVNAYNDTKSTPLLLASMPYNYEKEVVRTLIAYGAHLDTPNMFGDRPSSLLMKSSADDFPHGEHISLKCLCANIIIESDIPYHNNIPRALEEFVRTHEICPVVKNTIR